MSIVLHFFVQKVQPTDKVYLLLEIDFVSGLRIQINCILLWCRKPVSNRHDIFISRDFKSRASAYSAIPAPAR